MPKYEADKIDNIMRAFRPDLTDEERIELRPLFEKKLERLYLAILADENLGTWKLSQKDEIKKKIYPNLKHQK